jgi:hypothetical protein
VIDGPIREFRDGKRVFWGVWQDFWEFWDKEKDGKQAAEASRWQSGKSFANHISNPRGNLHVNERLEGSSQVLSSNSSEVCTGYSLNWDTILGCISALYRYITQEHIYLTKRFLGPKRQLEEVKIKDSIMAHM